MGRTDNNKSSWLTVVVSILGLALAFALVLMLSGLTDLPWRNWGLMPGLFLLFSAMGVYVGTIAVLDGRSDMAEMDRSVLRTALCGCFGALITFLAQPGDPWIVDPTWLAVNACVGAVLGYIGWAWAKYIFA